MKNLRTEWVEFSTEGSGSDHIHIDDEKTTEEIAICGCCRGHEKLKYIYIYKKESKAVKNNLK
jgi:hypothetical protein